MLRDWSALSCLGSRVEWEMGEAGVGADGGDVAGAGADGGDVAGEMEAAAALVAERRRR